MRPARRPAHPHRRALAAAAVLALTGALSGVLAGCDDDAPPRPEPAAGPDLTGADLWLSFEDPGTSVSGAPVFDDAARGAAEATVVAAGEGAVQLVDGVDGSGTAVRFPARCADPDDCPRAMLEVDHEADLDPGDRDFEFGAAVRLPADQATTGSNIVQKGRFGTDGGQWKLQVDTEDGEPSCVLRSADAGAEPVVVRSTVAIADDAWHRVLCRRDGGRVTIEVDGEATSREGLSGSVGNEWPVRVGAPGVGDGDDQFHGDVDDVYLTID